MSSLRAVFSTKVPVPPEQALCISTCLLRESPSPEKKIVFMSSPPISLTKRTAGCSRSTAAATATTSWKVLAADQRRRSARAGAGEEDRSRPGVSPWSRSSPLEQLEDLFGLAGLVALVRLRDGHLSPVVEHVFAGRAADVHATDRPVPRSRRSMCGRAPECAAACWQDEAGATPRGATLVASPGCAPAAAGGPGRLRPGLEPRPRAAPRRTRAARASSPRSGSSGSATARGPRRRP